MSNCPKHFQTIHGSALEKGKEYRYKSDCGEAYVIAEMRVDHGDSYASWLVRIVRGVVQFPGISDRFTAGDKFFVKDKDKVLYEPRS